MSTFKKVISLVLCIAMLAGSFAFVGDLVAPIASAADETPTTGEETTVAGGETPVTIPAETGLKEGQVNSYSYLNQYYGSGKKDANGIENGFVYFGYEFYEFNADEAKAAKEADDAKAAADPKYVSTYDANDYYNILTDHYVKPGDTLMVKVYVKSNMKCGDFVLCSMFDKNYWDVKLLYDNVPEDQIDEYTGYNYGVEPFTNVNKAHTCYKDREFSVMMTSMPSNGDNTTWLGKNCCGFSDEYRANHDFVMISSLVNKSPAPAYDFTDDAYMFEYKVKVKTGLADGTTFSTESPRELWQIPTYTRYLNRKGNIFCSHPTQTDVDFKSTLNINKMPDSITKGYLDSLLLDGLNHTFTIGEKPQTTEETYNAEFYEADGTTKIGDTATFKKDDNIAFPAKADGQVAWALVVDGINVPGTLIKPDASGNYSYKGPERDIKFMRVLNTDRFDVKLSLGDDVTVDESKLPAGVTYDSDAKALVISLPVDGTFDISTIPAEALSKQDNTFNGWDTADVKSPSSISGTTLTLGSVNGKMGTKITAALKAKWITAEYTAKYYASKEAYLNGDAPVFSEEITAGKNGTYDARSLSVTDKKFAGWYRADTDAPVNSGRPLIGAYTFSKDLDFYANWSDYKNTATFLIRDYENGSGWKTAYIHRDTSDNEKATLYTSTLKTIRDNAVKAIDADFIAITNADPDTLTGDDFRASVISQVNAQQEFVSNVEFSGHVVYYIVTNVSYNVIYRVPEYNKETRTFATDKFANEFDYKVQASGIKTTDSNQYYAESSIHAGDNAKINVPVGWKISGWVDAKTDDPVEFTENGKFIVSGLATRSYVLVAKFELVQYPVTFDIKDSDSPEIVTLVGTVSLGDSIVIDGKKFTRKNGDETVLPKIDVENADQVGIEYNLKAGHVFKGWSYVDADVSVDESGEELLTPKKAAAVYPLTLTENVIRLNLINGTIRFSAEWEAKEYKLSFYIKNAAGEEVLLSDPITVKAGEKIANYMPGSEAIAEINKKAPEGTSFAIWLEKESGQPYSSTGMPAKDLAFVASYVKNAVTVYVDENNLSEKDLNQSISTFRAVTLMYGQDVTENKEEYGQRTFVTAVTSQYYANEVPSEIVGWEIYHIHDAGDLYNEDKWDEGVNDEGTNIAKDTLIFRPIWKAHKDMLIRLYDTSDKIYFALGKDFKFHFWKDGTIVNGFGDVEVNRDPENNIVLFHTMEIERLDGGISFRFDAYPIPKYIFSIDGMIGIFKMLGNLIGSLFD